MKPILLIDLSSIFFPAWKASGEDHKSTIDSTIFGIGRCIERAGGDALTAVCCDSRNNWRKERSPAYKADREALPQGFYDCLGKVKLSIASRVALWEVDGFEADDILGTATDTAIERGATDVIIATGDKDMLQLLAATQVRVLKTTDYTFCTAENVIERFGVAPDRFADFLAICGDKADGVKGAPGVGPKHAAAALGKWGNLTALFAALESDPAACGTIADGTPYAWATSLAAHYDDVMLARELVQLRRDVPIYFAEIYETQETKMADASEEKSASVATAEKVFNTTAQYDSTPVRHYPEFKIECQTGSPGSIGSVIEWPLGQPAMGSLTTSLQIDRIGAAMAKAQGMIQGAKKDSDNPFFKSRYTSLASVWDACRSALSTVGIAVVQIPNGEGGKNHRLTTLLIHSSGQWIGGTLSMTAKDDTPQAGGSCITYLRRYALAAMVGIASIEDDDDANEATIPTNAGFKRG